MCIRDRYHFLPTHMNRNEAILEEALKFALEGGNVDFTAISDLSLIHI